MNDAEARAATAPAIKSGSPATELIATFFGIGRLKPGPGTWASVATVVLWGAVGRFVPDGLRWQTATACACVITAIGIAVSNQIVRTTGIKDPQFIVIDEVAGQLIALIAAPLTWQCLLAGLILFRAFDILKPPPVRQLEKLAAGWGVMLDDVAAGAIALAILQVLVRTRVLR